MKKQPSQPVVIYRPWASDATKDFLIPRETAENLYSAGIIHRDATNGGYCPNPENKYNVKQHRVD